MTADDWKWNADFLNEKAAVLKKAGIVSGYHNHNFEFAPLKDAKTTGMDILLKGTDPSLVTFEMDVGWVTAAGHDPFALLKKHPASLHPDARQGHQGHDQGQFRPAQDPTEVGSGMIAWPKLLARRLRRRCPGLLCRAGAAVRP
jgi:sugar phosphate isomerase/epimerase